jgi:Flp pilus assembly protein TadD
VTLARAGAQAGLRHPLVFRLLARDLERKGQFGQAIGLLRQGLELSPRDPALMTLLGTCLTRAGRPLEATRAFRGALGVDPKCADAFYGLGDLAALQGEADAAEDSFTRAIQVRPDHVEALAALATLLARTGRIEDARPHAERALALRRDHPIAASAMATIEIAEGDHAGAEARLQALLMSPSVTPLIRATAYAQLGDARHGQGRWREAFRSYEVAGASFRELYAPTLGAGSEAFQARLEDLARRIEATEACAWTPPEAIPPGPARTHVFLIGFPRSGTTLLEQVLAAHPAVETLEERPTLALLEEQFLIKPEGMAALTSLEPGRVARLRRDYWDRVRGFGANPGGKVFIDKLPLNLVNLPLIARLFPDAKVLLALRDPRDVVLSGFRRTFGLNAPMFGLLTLEGAAAFYDRAMTLVERSRERLPLDLHEVRYERLVSDFEQETRALCDFLALDWLQEMTDFAQAARRRTINTPSAAQVRQELYAHGNGQWRAYGEQMAAVLPVLEPWVTRFGYGASAENGAA